MRSLSLLLPAVFALTSVTAATELPHTPTGVRNLSPLLQNGYTTDQIKEVSKVILPGMNVSYAGYFNVNATDNANLFFWYTPAADGNPNAKILAWFQGGPGGASSFGQFTELGPYRLTANLTPVFNPYTWCLHFSCVFVDNPRNTGYSYANTYCTDYTCYANDAANFFEQFLPAFNLTNVDFAITGESYGGKYVPAIAGEIYNRNPHTNLKAIAIGNGFTDPALMIQRYPDLMYNTGLLDDADYLVAQSYVTNITNLLNQNDYVGAYHVWDAFINGDTTIGGAWFQNVTGLSDYFNYAEQSQPVEFGYSSQYMVQQFVRDALGVGNQPFQDGNVNVEINLMGDVLVSQKFNLASLLTGGVKVMVYNGHLDIICGAILTNAYVPTIEWPGQSYFNQVKRTIWTDPVTGDVNGWVRQYNNFVQTVVHSCGHICPYDTPARTQDMITRFINDLPWN